MISFVIETIEVWKPITHTFSPVTVNQKWLHNSLFVYNKHVNCNSIICLNQKTKLRLKHTAVKKFQWQSLPEANMWKAMWKTMWKPVNFHTIFIWFSQCFIHISHAYFTCMWNISMWRTYEECVKTMWTTCDECYPFHMLFHMQFHILFHTFF